MNHVCPSCGTTLPEKVRQAFCPVCTLRGALQTDGPAEATAAIRFVDRVGDYELIEEIAHGGVGAVYKARQISLGRIVALKLLLAGHFADPKTRQRFRAEAESAARLRHPNIVTIHEVGEHEGQPFLAMEFIEGGTLADRVRAQPLPVLRAAACVARVARAIAHAHAQGIVHRDLKPSNILLDRFEEPRVTDFGLAKRLDTSELETRNAELTLTGQVLGSPVYMSPEQAMGRSRDIGPVSDVYSLGAILYELLTSRPLFQGSTPHTVIEQVKSSDPVPPRRLNASIPVDVETICLKCLEKEPVRRYAGAQEFADDLERFLHGEPVRARPVSPIGKTVRWARRHRGAAAAILTCVVALIAITVVTSITSIRVSRAQAATEKARVEATRRLAESLISEAHALRISGQAGFREDTLARLSQARALDQDGTLRDGLRREAIAALVRPDIRRVSSTNVPRGADGMHCCFDALFQRCVNAARDSRAVYRVNDGELLQVIPKRGRICDEVVSFSPDGRLLLLRFGRAMQLVEADTARIVLETNLLGGPAAFSPDGTLFARGEDERGVSIYELAGFSNGAPGPARSWKHDAKARLTGLAFDPASKHLAITDETGVVSLRDATSDAVAWHERIAEAAWHLAWSADGQWLAVAADRDRLFILNGKDGTLHRQINTPTDSTTSLAFSPDGSRLACAGSQTGVRFFEPRSGRLLIADSLNSWHVRFDAEGHRLGTFLHGGRPTWIEALPPVGVVSLSGAHFADDDPNLTFSADGRQLLAKTAQGPRAWQVSTRRVSPLAPSTGATSVIFGSGTNELLISRRTTFVAREIDSGNESTLLTGGQWFWGNARSEDGRFVAVADHSGNNVTLIDRSERNAVRARLAIRSPERVAFSPDGRWLAAAAFYDRFVSIWDWQKSHEPVATLRPTSHLLHFSRDGQWLLTYGSALRLWRTSDWRPAELPIENDSFVKAASLSPDNRWLAMTQNDGTVHLIDLEARRTAAVLEPSGEGAIRNVVFHPGGNILALYRGQDVQLWDLPVLRNELSRLGLNWWERDAPVEP